MEVFATDRLDQAAQKIELSDTDVERISLKIIAQAFKDAVTVDRSKAAEREEARTWLAKDGATWLQALGYRISQRDIDGFLLECRKDDK